MVVYLLWHWAKKDPHAFISVNENGTLAISDRSRMWVAILAYVRWGRSRPRGWQKAAALLGPPSVVGAVLTLVAVSSLVGGEGANSGTTSASGEPTPTTHTLTVGDTWIAAKDGWLITVSDATTTDAFQGGIIGLPHVAQGTYLAVTVRLENTAVGEHALGKDRFKLSDTAGRSYSPEGFNESYGGGSYGSDIGSGKDVIPGGSIEGLLFFDVPRTDSGMQLQVIGGGVFLLGDIRSGGFVRAQATGYPAASYDSPGSCDASNKPACCPNVLESPETASTEALVLCVPWAQNSTRPVDWPGIAYTLCERKQTEDMPPAITNDPVVSTLRC